MYNILSHSMICVWMYYVYNMCVDVYMCVDVLCVWLCTYVCGY